MQNKFRLKRHFQRRIFALCLLFTSTRNKFAVRRLIASDSGESPRICIKAFHCLPSHCWRPPPPSKTTLCKDILLFYANEVEHNNLYLKRKWDNNVGSVPAKSANLQISPCQLASASSARKGKIINKIIKGYISTWAICTERKCGKKTCRSFVVGSWEKRGEKFFNLFRGWGVAVTSSFLNGKKIGLRTLSKSKVRKFWYHF